ncbi:hypothetical protein ACFY0G_02190 [Streptomyces sp. NPDC001552]|uniref:hypothetical protein n=1 Tax=Streptomyces sp. NPDC001552 TaxID=3364587 RepID=UPI00368E7ED8
MYYRRPAAPKNLTTPAITEALRLYLQADPENEMLAHAHLLSAIHNDNRGSNHDLVIAAARRLSDAARQQARLDAARRCDCGGCASCMCG